jgi:hypothetical protein
MDISSTARASRRDHRLDVFRGIALVMIFVNHVPGNFLERLTSRNFGFSDAAEAFVLMSGIAAALAYSGAFEKLPFREAAAKSWARARKLYLTHILISAMALSLVTLGVVFLDTSEMLKRINFMPVLDTPVEALIGVPTLGHQLGYFNILPLYMVLLLALPAYIMIARRSIGAMLAIAVAIWLAAGLWRLNLPNFPNSGGWFFNPVSWQLLFAFGLAGGLSAKRGHKLLAYSPWMMAAAIGYLVFSLLWARLRMGSLPGHDMVPFFIGGYDKTFLALPRLLHVLALAYVLTNIDAVSRLLAHRVFEPLSLMGRNGLHVFATGSVLAIAIQVAGEYLQANTVQNAILVVGSLYLQYAVARYVSATPKVAVPAAEVARSPAR